jgi:tRNA-2-methylthio-N6-dimethylallyladenosine synthase
MPIATQSTKNAPVSRKLVHLETFGCQMNELDSELVRGHLKALGYGFTEDAEAADVIIYNTCSVREQAENKVWSRIGIQGLRRREGAKFILGVIGCMAERDGTDMMRRFPHVDLMCGPGELDKLPMLIDNVMRAESLELYEREKKGSDPFFGRVALQGNTSRRVTTLEAANDNLELLDLSRAFDPDFSSSGAAGRSAYVRITRGCNKFCTYCVVPYTRGAEVHRPPDSIIDECKKLADNGVIEITLLGQTVNHYMYTHGVAVGVGGIELPQVGPAFKANVKTSKRQNVETDAASSSFDVLTFGPLDVSRRVTTFADLLRRIHDEVPAIQRLRFVTSFPRDFGDDILHVMADSPRICKYLHVPAQSGSNRILKLMNRGYTVEQYIEFIDRARAILSPDACIAGDIIVGFPTETDEDFDLTRQLLRRVRHKNNFIFKYSPRPGTVAIQRLADDVPEHVKRRRNNELLALQTEISAAVHAEFVGKTLDVFIEHAREKERTQVGDQKSQVRDQQSEAAQQRSGPRAVALTVIGNGHGGNGASVKPHAAAVDRRDGPERITHQLSGRTEGDLITVFDLPAGANPEQFIGRIVPVAITGSGSLLLHGELAGGAPNRM